MLNEPLWLHGFAESSPGNGTGAAVSCKRSVARCRK